MVTNSEAKFILAAYRKCSAVMRRKSTAFFVQRGDFKIEYLAYDWGVNDQGEHGRNFRAGLFDRVFGNAK